MIATSTRERRRQIEALITELGFMRNSDLADRLAVSTVTIRQDLEALAGDGVIQKVYGGAVAAGGSGSDTAFDARAGIHTLEKKRIGQAAAALICPRDTLLLDAGSTILEIARHLPEHLDLTVVTPALNVAMEAGKRAGVNVIVCGGQYNPQTLSASGHIAEQVLRQVHADRLFLAAHSVSIDKGIADRNFANAQIKRALIQTAREVVLCCDASKFGLSSPVLVADLDAVHRVVTSDAVPPAFSEWFESHDIPVDAV